MVERSWDGVGEDDEERGSGRWIGGSVAKWRSQEVLDTQATRWMGNESGLARRERG